MGNMETKKVNPEKTEKNEPTPWLSSLRSPYQNFREESDTNRRANFETPSLTEQEESWIAYAQE